MIFLEAYVRPLLMLHAVGGAVVVGATSHQLIWSRAYSRGDFRRHRSEKRFVAILAIAYVLAFVGGNLLYPTYKVRVRSEYFDDAGAVAMMAKLRADRHLGDAVDLRASPTSLAGVARVFDIKEHCVALGCAAALGLFWLSRRAHPSEVSSSAPLYLGLSLFACVAAWIGLLVGLYTTSVRAVGS